MKRLLILIAFVSNGLLAQTLPYPSYPQYMDINGQLHISTVPFTSLAVGTLPTSLSGYGIIPASGDYSAFYVSLSGSYANPSWLTSLAWSKITGAPTIYTFTGTSAQYTKGDGTYGTLPSSYAFTGTSSQYTKGDGTYGTLIPNTLQKAANYTVLSTDFTPNTATLYITVDCTSGNNTITLPTATSYPGYQIVVAKSDATSNTLTISGLNQDNLISVQYSSKTALSQNGVWVNN